MNVRGIVEEYLKAHGFDGLCNNNCGCVAGDLMPCEMDNQHNCEPGWVVYCKDCALVKKCDSDAKQIDNDVAYCVSSLKKSAAEKKAV